MAKLIKANGEIIDVQPANGRDFTLVELRALVGGHVESVRSGDPAVLMICNEEGHALDLPINSLATRIYHAAGGILHAPVLGDVVIAHQSEVN